MISKVFHELVDLVFPHCCPGCNQPLVKGENEFCLECLHKLPFVTDTYELQKRFHGRIDIVDIFSLFYFHPQGIVQKLLHNFKYQGNKQLGVVLSRMLCDQISGQHLFDSSEIVVPVPLHRSKLAIRGFNQSEVIATELAVVTGKKLKAHCIQRTKKSETQTKKSRADRWKNVENIFEITDDSLQGKSVLLIDDVITTGATIESCGQVILDAGASELSIASLAMAM